MRDAPSCRCGIDDRRFPSFVLDNIVRRVLQPPRRFLSKYVRPGDAVADLGCGSGHFTIPLSRIVGRDGRVLAVDFDGRAIARLLRKAERQGLDHLLEAHTSSAAEIDFVEAGSFDFVLAEGLLCCMTDHAGAMRQIRRILRPTGRAYLSVMKAGRERDPRTVTAQEWASILSAVQVVESGEGPFTRWALVHPHPAAS